MAALAAIAMVVGTVVSAAGTIAAGQAQKRAAEQQKRIAEFEAAQYEVNAKEEQAAAQRDALEYDRKKKLALSSLQSESAASGFTATDPTSLAIADEITRYGTYQEQMAAYGGASRREGLEAKAMARRMEGDAALAEGKAKARASYWSAAGTILGGMSGMGRYG